jgi:hypothetical protein
VSDARLRELERGDDAGDVAARVRLITERLRVGAISMGQVGLAAFVGDEAALVAAGAVAPPPTDEFNDWWIRLVERGPRVATRSFCAVASRIVHDEHVAALRQVMDWCVCPRHVHGCIVDQSGLPGGLGMAHGPRRDSALVVETARAASRWSRSTERREVRGSVLRIAELGLDEHELRGTIRAALVPWLLRDVDPLLGDRREQLTGTWACALLGGGEHEAGALDILRQAQSPTPELRRLDALWTTRLPFWPSMENWLTTGRLRCLGGISIERTQRVLIVRSFARWGTFLRDAELRRAHLHGVHSLGQLIGAPSIAWAADDEDLAAAAREGADLNALVARLTAKRGPPAASRLDDASLPEGANSWWFVPLPT